MNLLVSKQCWGPSPAFEGYKERRRLKQVVHPSLSWLIASPHSPHVNDSTVRLFLTAIVQHIY